MEQIGTSHEEQVIGAALAESGHWLAHVSKLTPDLFVTYLTHITFLPRLDDRHTQER